MNKSSKINEAILKTIRDGNKPRILDYTQEKKIKIPRLWLFYDFDLSAFILAKRTYDNKNKRSFNHTIIDDLILDDCTNEEIQKIFDTAIEKIEEGKCLCWKNNTNFVEIMSCNKSHS